MAHPSDTAHEALQRVLVFANGKGGVGKSSLTANEAGLLAANGYNVLLVDLDPQGDLDFELGVAAAGLTDQGANLTQALLGQAELTPVRGIRDNLDLIPGGPELLDYNRKLGADRLGVGTWNLPGRFAHILAGVAPNYDVVLVDCPPSLVDILTEALTAARWLIVPTRTDESSQRGLEYLAGPLRDAQEAGSDVALLGIVLFGVTTSASRVRHDARTRLASVLGENAPIFDVAIRYKESTAAAVRARGQLVHELRRSAVDRSGDRLTALSADSLAADYIALTEEIMTTLAQHESEEN